VYSFCKGQKGGLVFDVYNILSITNDTVLNVLSDESLIITNEAENDREKTDKDMIMTNRNKLIQPTFSSCARTVPLVDDVSQSSFGTIFSLSKLVNEREKPEYKKTWIITIHDG